MSSTQTFKEEIKLKIQTELLKLKCYAAQQYVLFCYTSKQMDCIFKVFM